MSASKTGPAADSGRKAVPQTKPTDGADLIVHYLEQLGVDNAFGVPGGAIEPMFNALARSQRRGGLAVRVARHEASAACMAEGFYRESGKMAMVCATTGPGATNLITGVSAARANHIPMLVITAQTALPKFGRRAMQESSCTAIDTVAMLRHCTRFSTLVSHIQQLEGKLVSAIMAAHRSPRSPVHLSVPADVLSDAVSLPQRIHADLFSHDFAIADVRAIDILCKKIDKVDTIAVFIDGYTEAATREVVRFCELVNAPFVVGQSGKYWVDETHPLYRGVYGFAGHRSAREVFGDARVDLIIAVGTDLTEFATGGWQEHLLNTRLVHIDSNPEHFTRSPMANHHVCSAPQLVFERVNAFVMQRLRQGKSWQSCVAHQHQRNALGGCAQLERPEKCFSDAAPIKPQRLFATLNRHVPNNTRIYIDTGNTWAWMTHYFVNRDCAGLVRGDLGFGSMGWALGAAIGSAFANPRDPIVCVVGDGAYLMGAQELSVAAQYHLPIVVIVLNDSALGMVMHGQRLAGAEPVGWQIQKVNFGLQAQSMGVPGIVVKTAQQLDNLRFDELFSLRGPVLLDVLVDREEVPPIIQRVQGLSQ